MSAARLLEHCQTPALYWINFSLRKRVVFQKGGFGGCSPGTKTGTRVHSGVPPERKPETGYVRMFPRNENRNEGTFACSPGTKTGTRVHLPKPPLITKPPFCLPVTFDILRLLLTRFIYVLLRKIASENCLRNMGSCSLPLRKGPICLFVEKFLFKAENCLQNTHSWKQKGSLWNHGTLFNPMTMIFLMPVHRLLVWQLQTRSRFKPGCLQFYPEALFCALAPFCALVRTCVCAHLCSFPLICVRTRL